MNVNSVWNRRVLSWRLCNIGDIILSNSSDYSHKLKKVSVDYLFVYRREKVLQGNTVRTRAEGIFPGGEPSSGQFQHINWLRLYSLNLLQPPHSLLCRDCRRYRFPLEFQGIILKNPLEWHPVKNIASELAVLRKRFLYFVCCYKSSRLVWLLLLL